MFNFAIQKYFRLFMDIKTFGVTVVGLVGFSSCVNQFNQVYKSPDNDLKYEYAKECFAKGKYLKATTLLQELVTIQKGTDKAEESLYMLAMGEFNGKDYETAAEYFKNTIRRILKEYTPRTHPTT